MRIIGVAVLNRRPETSSLRKGDWTDDRRRVREMPGSCPRAELNQQERIHGPSLKDLGWELMGLLQGML